MPDTGKLLEIMDDEITADEQQLFEEYTDYVYRTYMDVPEGMTSLSEAYRHLYEQYGDADPEQWIEIIQKDLAENCEYEKYGLEDASEESNLIDDFYGSQKKGYCIHFASAGVILLRMAGVPARYVTGYVAWPDDFSYNSDTGRYHAAINGYGGHAWVEIYDSEAGVWLPADMTPAGRSGNMNESSETEEIISSDSENNPSDDTREESKSSEMTVSAANSDNDNARDASDSNNKVTESSDSGGKGYRWIFVLACAGAIAAMTVLWIGTVYQKGRIQRFSRVNRSKALLSMEWHLSEQMEKAGWKPEKPMNDWEYAAWVQKKIDTLEEGEYLYFMEKLHQAAYSEEMLTEEEYQKCHTIYQKILNKIHKKS